MCAFLSWGDTDTASSSAVEDLLERLQQQYEHIDWRFQRIQMQAEQSITSAADIGRLFKASPAWIGSSRPVNLYGMLDAEEATINELISRCLGITPHSWEECMRLELKERAKSDWQLSNSTSESDTVSISAERQIHLGWAYVLRQLKQVGEQHVQWHLYDTSDSGITGHSGKVDFCFSAVQQKAWPQVVALLDLKRDLQTESLHAECIGQLTARSENIFANQPLRKYVVMIAGGADQLEVLAFFRNGPILRSGLQPRSFDPSSGGLRWLSKVVFSSLPAMGFVPDLPPFTNTTPKGLFEGNTSSGMSCWITAPRALLVVQVFLLAT